MVSSINCHNNNTYGVYVFPNETLTINKTQNSSQMSKPFHTLHDQIPFKFTKTLNINKTSMEDEYKYLQLILQTTPNNPGPTLGAPFCAIPQGIMELPSFFFQWRRGGVLDSGTCWHRVTYGWCLFGCMVAR